MQLKRRSKRQTVQSAVAATAVACVGLCVRVCVCVWVHALWFAAALAVVGFFLLLPSFFVAFSHSLTLWHTFAYSIALICLYSSSYQPCTVRVELSYLEREHKNECEWVCVERIQQWLPAFWLDFVLSLSRCIPTPAQHLVCISIAFEWNGCGQCARSICIHTNAHIHMHVQFEQLCGAAQLPLNISFCIFRLLSFIALKYMDHNWGCVYVCVSAHKGVWAYWVTLHGACLCVSMYWYINAGNWAKCRCM